MDSSSQIIADSIRCSEPVLLPPAQPTPYELKLVSDIDDQEGLRFELPFILFFRPTPSMAGRDTVAVVKHALARTLVFYYPLAGRMREAPGANRKLMVDCNGEGILFVRADASIRFDHLGDPMLLPPSSTSHFVRDVDGSGGLLNCPLLLVQVTRLLCGGLVIGFRFNHVMTDAGGMFQFLAALADISRGDAVPSVPPVWDRELLTARDPPRQTCSHGEYDEDDDDSLPAVNLFDDMVHRWFYFGRRDFAAMKRRLPASLRRSCTNFEILAACIWRSRTIALGEGVGKVVRLFCVANSRSKFSPPLPEGYYGNLLAFPAAVAEAGRLRGSSLGYAVELVRKTKGVVTEEYMRSVADVMALRGRPQLNLAGGYMVSDITQFQAHKEELEFAWGRMVYGGPGNGGPGPVEGVSSYFLRAKSRETGEDQTLVPVCLPRDAMERFEADIERMITAAAEPSMEVEGYDSSIEYDHGLSKM